MRSYVRWVLAAGLSGIAIAFSYRGVRGQEPVLGASGLRAYVAEVLATNAAYRAAEARAQAAGRRIGPAGALPDPMLAFGVMSVPAPSFDFRAEPMTQLPIMFQQTFPFPGKQRAAMAFARADSAVASERARAVAATLAAAAAAAYYGFSYARTALAVWRERLKLAEQATAVSRVRYETGKSPQTDLLRARLRRAQLIEEGLGLEADSVRALAQLDVLRGGPGGPVTAPVLVTAAGLPGVDVSGDTVTPTGLLASRLVRGNPELRVAQSEAGQAAQLARVFEVAARPDFSFTLQYGPRFAGRQAFFTASLGLSLPLWMGRKQAPAARGAELEAEAARQRYADAQARMVGEVEAVRAEVAALQGRVRQGSEEIVPLAAAASTSALQRYEVGDIEFTAVLDAQDDLFRAQLNLARSIADYGAGRARLAALVGEEWYR